MPWSNQPNNQFSKVSSMDGGDRSDTGAHHVGSNKSQPAAPQPSHGHYQDEGYNYGRHGAGGGYGGHHQEYDGYNGQDDYYNPNYAQQTQGPSPSYQNTSYQDPRGQFQQAGYYPPPPPVSSHAHHPSASASPNLVSSTLSSTNLTTSSSVRRGPQVILPEKGSPYDDDETQHIPMNDLAKS